MKKISRFTSLYFLLLALFIVNNHSFCQDYKSIKDCSVSELNEYFKIVKEDSLIESKNYFIESFNLIPLGKNANDVILILHQNLKPYKTIQKNDKPFVSISHIVIDSLYPGQYIRVYLTNFNGRVKEFIIAYKCYSYKYKNWTKTALIKRAKLRNDTIVSNRANNPGKFVLILPISLNGDTLFYPYGYNVEYKLNRSPKIISFAFSSGDNTFGTIVSDNYGEDEKGIFIRFGDSSWWEENKKYYVIRSNK